MKDQHKMIKGYRDLSQEEIDLMNEIKAEAERVKALIIKVKSFRYAGIELARADMEGLEAIDQRWVAIAQTELQQGFMALTRSVAKPESF